MPVPSLRRSCRRFGSAPLPIVFSRRKKCWRCFFTQRFGIKKMLLVGLITAAIRYGFFVYGAQKRISLTPCRSTVFCCTA
ncbi:hypothetical protein AHN95_14080 [Salmonella enterica subsp. arizonae]|uniref:Uncharacterized protein n=2 Tax=Salmonella enterica TaxID=28901 RepID=A0A741AP35_SALET|nr:hypothetical protein [Salmonella enterica]EBP3476485.1 hypothetical protein [Salmonella enterica subsp. enterica]ECC2883758.1 hypothetical protein [Salmonella enterica subsp. arizonae]HAE8120242.1 hypothetical protein [Salmonella enterica subsp. arizonae serovar 18:z4,z32:-]HAF0406119.1 hypothetical protein [Salmonella enterica subsp. enterica serovar 6,7:c:1,5]